MIERPNIEWKDVPGYEGKFRISNYGDLICLGYINSYGRRVKPYEKRFEESRISNSGYYMVVPNLLRKEEEYIHRLVLKCFVGDSERREDQTDVNHKDGNKKNNFVGTNENNYKDGNLEWCSRKENMSHASRNDLINRDSAKRKETLKLNRQIAIENSKRPVVQLDMDGKYIQEYSSIKEASEKTGISAETISSIARNSGYHKSIKGTQWIYKEDYNPTKDYKYKTCQFEKAKKKVAQCDMQGNLIAIHNSRLEAARSIGTCGSSYITECCQGKRKTYKGFIWKNAE